MGRKHSGIGNSKGEGPIAKRNVKPIREQKKTLVSGVQKARREY